jgi:iron complex outermembrane receptor protein
MKILVTPRHLRRIFSLPRWVSSAAALAAFVPLAAAAAAAPESSSTVTEGAETSSHKVLEELVVTARRRSEPLQTTPVAISSFSADALARTGITDLRGVAGIAPNLSINPAKQSKSISSFVRGVGQDEDFFTFQPAVGFYLDDVYQGTLFGAAFDLLDIERIEVLRGPQGTLFGKSTEGGAIRVFTREPTGNGSGYIEAGSGSFNRVDFRAATDLTIIPDRLFLRVSGGGAHAGGYVDLVDFVCAKPAQAGKLPSSGMKNGFSDCVVDKLGDLNVVSVRAAAKFLAPSLVVNVRVDYTNDKSSAAADKLVAVNPRVLANLNNNVFMPRDGVKVDERFLTGEQSFSTYGTFVDPDSGRRMPIRSTAITRGISGSVDWDMSRLIHVKSITAYRKSDGDAGWDTDNTPLVLNHSYRNYQQNQFSQELLFSGDTLADRLRWTLGGFYFTQDLGGPALVLTGPAGVGLAASFSDVGKDKSWSLFGHGVVDLTKSLHLELGYRHSNEDRQYTFVRDYFALFKAPTSIPTQTSQDRNDYRVGASFDVTHDVMIYANVSTGYKAGGFNPRPVFPSQIVSFKPETVTAYEFGFKSNLFDRRLTANFAGFMSDYKDVQKPAFQPSTCQGTPPVCSPVFVFSNVGNARIWGLEGELTAILADRLTLNAALGYTHFEYTFLNQFNPPGGATLDSKPAFVPERQFALGAQYEFALPGGSTLTPRADYMYRSKVFFGAANLPEAAQPGYGLVNARITWQSSDKLWSAVLAGTNLTDKFYYVYLGETLNSIGIVNGQPARPREFQFTVRRAF